jgi:uncharacterized protein (DUF433 family)
MEQKRIDEVSVDGTALSPVEAAWVTELSRKTVDQAIDREEVRPLPAEGDGAPSRSLGYTELVYLGVRRQVGTMLSPSGRRLLYAELRRTLPDNPEPDNVAVGYMTIHVGNVVATVRRRLSRIQGAEQYVSIRPDVRAGEPVVRGTRVPVHVLADLAEQGASAEELLQDYPAVTPEALEAALLYARLHPRRGPRRPAPWHPESSGKRPAN